MNVIILMLTVGLLWCFCSILYQSAIRPVITDTVRFQFFRLRDELRGKAVRGELSQKEYSYQYMENKLNRLVHYTKWFTIGNLVEIVITNRESFKTTSKERLRFEKEANAELLKIDEQSNKLLLVTMGVNSPGYMLIGVVIVGILGVFGLVYKTIAKSYVQRVTEPDMEVEGLAPC